MASFVTKHPKTGWRYQRHIPKDVRPLLGGRKVSVRYIPAMPRREAERLSRSYAVSDDESWKKLRGLSAAESAHLIASGGLEKTRGSIPVLESLLEAIRYSHAQTTRSDPRETAKAVKRMFEMSPDRPPLQVTVTPEFVALHNHDHLQKLKDSERETSELIQRRTSVLKRVVLEDSEYSLNGLLALWVKVREPKSSRKHALTIERLKSVIGDMDYRAVTADHIAQFRDHLETLGLSKRSQFSYLSHIKTLFSAAVSERKIPDQDNPTRGIQVRGKRPSDKASDDRPFTGAQERLILAKAEETKFGGKRHAEVMWMLRLLAWTGARPNEIAQLRKRDVRRESGIPLIHIREDHHEQSVKTGEARKIPLPAAVVGFLDFAEKAKTDFVFAAFPYDKNNGRRAWLTSNFGAFLRKKCEITDPQQTLYSFRHRFIDATRDAGEPMTEELSKALTGHSTGDVHGKYGKGAGLKTLAEAMAKVDPLAD
jgi:integrase